MINHGSAYEKAVVDKKHNKMCRDPGLNRGPLYLQSNALPTELSRLYDKDKKIMLDSLQRIENKKGFDWVRQLFTG